MKSSHLPWNYRGRSRNRVASKSIFKIFLMIIGLPQPTNSWYRVSRRPQPVRISNGEGAEVVIVGKYHYTLELRFSANTTVRLFAVLSQKLSGLIRPNESDQTERV
jgi:hypothetical protein